MLKNLTLEQLSDWVVAALGEPRSRGMQLWRALYHSWPLLEDLRPTIGTPNGFSAAFVDRLTRVASLGGGMEVAGVSTAPDGTQKLACRLTTGPAAGMEVECVLIPMPGSKPRMTVCISSQVGCAQNCQFCFTGRMGLLGQLSPAQIVQQVVLAKRQARPSGVAKPPDPSSGPEAPVTNVVFMGMGEPLHNAGSVAVAVEVLTHPQGLGFPASRVCVSTVGLVPEMRAFAARSRAALAVSLHATTDEVRNWLVPINRRHPLRELVAALEELFPAEAQRAGRHVLVQYVLLRGVNDGEADAHRLADLLARVRCKVNLIGFNPHPGTRFAPSGERATQAFLAVLRQRGCVVMLRASRGGEEMAACGQLGGLAGGRGAGDGALPRILPPPRRFEEVLAARS